MKDFKDLRIVDNFYQTSSFFPMPLTLIGTLDENGNQTTEMTENVNQKVKLILDILPQVEGYLKSANLKAVSENNSDVNFKITNVSYYQEENDLLDAKPSVNLEVNNEENVEEKTEELHGIVVLYFKICALIDIM